MELNDFIEEQVSSDTFVNKIDFSVFKGAKEWEFMYVFSEAVEAAHVSEVIGFNYTKEKYGLRLILFTNENDIVYEQRERPSFDGGFSIIYDFDSVKFHRSNTVFSTKLYENKIIVKR